MISEFVGRGATRSRAFIHNDVVVLLLEDGATRAEVNLVAAGRARPRPRARNRMSAPQGWSSAGSDLAIDRRDPREHYGRGPMKAKTYALDDIIVVVMRGSGFTALEQTIMDSGERERIVELREDFQRMMAFATKRRSRS
jgi:uncharacterized protein YbcI